MAEFIVQESTLTALADAVRSKTGTTGKMTLNEMTSQIQNLSVGGSVETATVTFSTNSNRVWATVYEDGEFKAVSEMVALLGFELTNAVRGSILMVRVINAVGTVTGATLVHEVGITDESGQHSWFSCYQVN